MSNPKDSAELRTELDRFMTGLVRRNPGEPEFHQAVREVAESVLPFTLEHPVYPTARRRPQEVTR